MTDQTTQTTTEPVIGRLAPRAWLPGDALPQVGTQCLVSGANADVDTDQHRAFGWRNVVGYGENDKFICLQTPGCWPTVERTGNCWFSEIPTPRTTPQPLAIGLDREAVALVIYDDLEGPVANQDFTRQTRQWEQCLRIADAILEMLHHGK